MTAHIHAALMAQYAQDAAETDKPWERWEFQRDTGVWEGFDGHAHGPTWVANVQYRRKPRTHMVNGIEVPAPMRDAPERGAKYWISVPDTDDYAASTVWSGSAHDNYDALVLARGLVHATKEAAVANAKAMIGEKA